MAIIDSRLLGPGTQVDITENLNRMLKLIDANKTRLDEYGARIDELEGTVISDITQTINEN